MVFEHQRLLNRLLAELKVTENTSLSDDPKDIEPGLVEFPAYSPPAATCRNFPTSSPAASARCATHRSPSAADLMQLNEP
jgi:hypothetical protein